MVPFDTLAYVKTLEQGGFERKLAENHARALSKLLTHFIHNKEMIISEPNNSGEIKKNIVLDILDYADQLICSNEKPKIVLAQTRLMTKYLLNML
jgi:hypothetical protein